MYPILFSIGSVHVYTHGLMIAIGASVGGLAIYFLGKNKGYRTEYLFDLIVYSMLGGLIGARILYVVLYFNQFADFKEMLLIWYGGLVSYGGIIGGFLAAWAILSLKKEPVKKWFDLGIIGLLIGWAFGRVGCLLNSDSYGIISASKIAVWGRIPTQIFESVWVLIAAAICFFFFEKKKKWNLPDATIFWGGLGLYTLGRFFIDFYRDEPNFLWGIKAGQLGSLVILFFTVIIIVGLLKKRETKKDDEETI